MQHSGNRENFSQFTWLTLLAAFVLGLAVHPVLAADSLEVKLAPNFSRAPMPNRLGHKPFKPLLSIKSNTKSIVEYDMNTGAVVETISLPTKNGEMVLQVEYWSVLDYLKQNSEERQDSLFNSISSDYVSGQANARIAQERGLMPEINLPDFMPKSLASIIGEGTGSLVIHGQSVTEVSGTTTFQIPEDQSLFRQQSKFPRLKLEQRQQINIEGTIGTKIHIFVDYNSQNQFENRNRIEVKYQGEEDEILQSLELGDVNLSLPPSMLVAANIPRGNFGIKGETRLGALTTTFIASQEEGESSQKNVRIPVSGQAEATDSLHLWDVNYSRNRHFLLVDTSAIDYTHMKILDRNGVKLINPQDKPQSIRVFKDDGVPTNNNQGIYQARPGIAHVDVQKFIQDGIPDPNDEFGFYNEMELNKDYILEECGVVISFSWVNDKERIGVIYTTNSGVDVGEADGDTLQMQMIKSSIMTSQNPIWPRMLRNVYTFGGGGAISAQNFDINIFTNETPPRYDESGKTFLQIFGLDNDGDTKVDRIYVDFTRGLIFFPSLEPFYHPYDENGALFGLQQRNQRMYTEDDPSRLNTLEHQKYQMVLRYSRAEGSQASTFQLGAMQIIENSERIYINDRLLKKGTDYTIDYQFGSLTLNPSVDIPANSEVKVNFEEVPLFATGSTSLFGFHNEYGFDPNRKNYLTSTLFFQSVESVDRTFVRLGDEPKNSLLGEVGGKFEFDSDKVTEWLNFLPNFESRTPSQFNIVGGLAFSNPNPNTRGGVLIEDFETAKIENPRLNMIYQSWRLSSVPKQVDGNSPLFTPEDAGELIWFDPYFVSQTAYGFYEEDVYGQIEGRTAQHRKLPVDVISAVFRPKGDNVFERRQSWRSFVQVVSETGVLGMDEREVLQVYIATGRDQGKLIIDFGQVDEDQVRFDVQGVPVGVNRLDTEDKNFDGRLDIGEDTGLDGVAGLDKLHVAGDDQNDDFYRPPYNQDIFIPDATGLNKTEGNNQGQIGDNFDTEDLNNNGALDQVERVFRVKLDLKTLEIIPPDGVFIPASDRNVVKDHVPYEYDPNGGRARDAWVQQLGDDDWYLLEIPLPREGTRFENYYEKVNSPSLSKILHVRLTFYDFEKPDTVNFANISFVGNRFKRNDEGVIPRLSETLVDTTYSDTLWPQGEEPTLPARKRAMLSTTGYHGNVELVSVNTILNNEYYPPASISASLNKFNRSGRQEDFTAQEAAIALNYNDLQRGYEGWALKAENNQQSYLDYASMSFFINGRQGPNAPKPTFFIRLGTDKDNYYEYSMPVDTGWVGVTVPFQGFLSLKDSLQSALSLSQIQQFKLDIKRGPYRIKGNPSLTKISIMVLGVANESSDVPLSGTVWVDDVLLTDVIREFGVNTKLQVEALLSDLGRLSISVGARDNKFRNLNENIPTNSKFDYTVGGSLNLDRLMPADWGLRIPITVRKTFSRSLPRFHPGSEDVTIELPESKELNKTEITSNSFSASYTKSRGESMLSRMLLNNLNGSMSYTNSRNIAPRSLSSSVNASGRLRYRATLPREADVPIFPGRVFGVLEKVPLPYFLKYNTLTKSFADARLRYMPNDFELSSSVSYRQNQRFDQVSRIFRLDSLLTMDNSVDVSYRPLQMAQTNYNLDVSRNLKETARGSKVLGFGYGNEISRKQNGSVQLQPKGLPWLVPQYRYTAAYNNDHSPQYVNSFPTGTDYRKFDTRQQQQMSIRFNPAQFRQSLAGLKLRDPNRQTGKSEGKPEAASSGTAYRRRGRGRAGGEGGQETGFFGKFFVRPFNYVIDSFDPLMFQSNLQHSDKWERMPSNPGFLYQIGLEDLPLEQRLRKLSQGDSTVVDTAQFSSFAWNFNRVYQSGLRIFNTRLSASYMEQGSNTHTLNGFQLSRSEGPELSFDYSNIWLPFFMRGTINTLSVSSGYKLSKGWRGSSVKIKKSNPLGIDSETRDEGWSPKYRVTANLGKTGGVRTLYQKNSSIKTDILADQNRRQVTVSNDDNINFQYSFSAPNGLNFPLLRRFKLKSNVRSSIDLRRKLERNFTEVIEQGNVKEILINRDTEDITITPTLGYDFSQVIGNLSASYNSHKDRKTGTTRITITMKMSIQLDF